MICSVKNCNKGSRSRGLCNKHYLRWYRNGDPLKTRKALNGQPAEFYNSLLEIDDRECVKWPHAVSGAGYAQIRMNNKIEYVHRLICKAEHGEPSDSGFYASHLCGKGHLGCVNPNHIQWCSPAENSAHRIIHGTTNRGERHGRHKLKKNDVLKIREDHRSINVIANEYNVSEGAIRSVQNRKNWSWLIS